MVCLWHYLVAPSIICSRKKEICSKTIRQIHVLCEVTKTSLKMDGFKTTLNYLIICLFYIVMLCQRLETSHFVTSSAVVIVLYAESNLHLKIQNSQS